MSLIFVLFYFLSILSARQPQHWTRRGVVYLAHCGGDGARAARRNPRLQTLRHAGLRVDGKRAHRPQVTGGDLFLVRRGAPLCHGHCAWRPNFSGCLAQRWRRGESVRERGVALALRGARLPRLQARVLKVSVLVEQLRVLRVELADGQRLAARLPKVGHVAVHGGDAQAMHCNFCQSLIYCKNQPRHFLTKRI